MKIIGDGIFFIDNFLFKETCDLLVSTFSKKNLKQSEKPGVFGGPSRGENDKFNKYVNDEFNKGSGFDGVINL